MISDYNFGDIDSYHDNPYLKFLFFRIFKDLSIQNHSSTHISCKWIYILSWSILKNSSNNKILIAWNYLSYINISKIFGRHLKKNIVNFEVLFLVCGNRNILNSWFIIVHFMRFYVLRVLHKFWVISTVRLRDEVEESWRKQIKKKSVESFKSA